MKSFFIRNAKGNTGWKMVLAVLLFSNGIFAQWDGPGGGVGGWVHATCMYKGKLYVGGEMNINGNYIAAWNGSTWENLGVGVDGQVDALCVYNNELYVGGRFMNAGGFEVKFIARWDGINWNEVSGGTNSIVYTMTVWNNKLIIGGYFNQIENAPFNYIASWDGHNFEPLGTGMAGREGQVMALTTVGNKLYAGGFFTTAGGIAAPHIAEWNGTAWSCPGGGISGIVYGLTNYNGKLIAGGLYTSAGGVPASRIAQWDGVSWSPLGAGLGGGPYGYCFDVQQIGTELYAGGIFTWAGSGPAANLARWDGTNWYPVADYMGSGGTVQAIYCMDNNNGTLVVGGIFSYISGSGSSVSAYNLASYTPPYTCSPPLQPSSIAVSGGGATVCSGNTRTYTVSAVMGATSYDWQIPAGAVLNSGAGTSVISLTFNSSYVSGDSLKVSAVNECGASPYTGIKINRTTVATPGIITGQAAGLCGSNSVSYSVTAKTGMTYNWTVPAGATIVSGQGTSRILADYPLVALSGKINLTASNNCGTSAVRSLAVKTAPGTPGAVSGPVTVCSNSIGNAYSVAPVPGATNYTWTGPSGSHVSDGLVISAKNILVTTFSSVTVDYGMVYSTSKLAVKASNACGTGASKTIALIPGVCSPAMVGTLQAEQTTDAEPAGLTVYPNPSSGSFVVSGTGLTGVMQLTDVSGRTVFSQHVGEDPHLRTIKVNAPASLPKGIYILQINNRMVKRLMIE